MRKVEWANQNKEVVRNHFKYRDNNPIDLNIDDFEKIIVADKESDKSNPLAGAAVNTATSTPSADALPF